MFERKRIKYNEETGVNEVEVYNPVKEAFSKIGEKAGDALEFVADHSTAIQVILVGGTTILIYGFSKGVHFTNKRILEGWKEDGYLCRGDGLVFKKKMTFSEWMDYLDHGYNTKKGWKNKNINKYLRERGFID